MKKTSLIVSALATIAATTGLAPLAHADTPPEFSATAKGGIDSVQVEVQRPDDFKSACRAYGVPAGSDPVGTDPAFDSHWDANWGVAGNQTWGWAMPALSIPNGDYDVYWACWDLNEDSPTIWGSDPAYEASIAEPAEALHITIKPESDRETVTIGEGPAVGNLLGSLGSSSLSFGS